MFKQLIFISLLFCLPVFGQIYQNHNTDVTNGLIAHWKLDEISYNGTQGEVKDSSGNGYDGTSYGKVITNPGKIGRAGYFDAANNWISSDTFPEMNIFSISIWVKPYDITQVRLIASRRWAYNSWQLGQDGDKVLFSIWQATGIQIEAERVEGALIQNKWCNITAIVDGTYVSIYVNGALKGSPVTYDGTIKESAVGVCIGKYVINSEYNFNGSIDDVRIYNRAITSNEVTKLYNLGTPKKETVAYRFAETPYENLPTNGLVAHWKLDEISYDGTAGEVKDSSGNLLDATTSGRVITNPSKLNRAGYFDRINGYIDCGNSSVLNEALDSNNFTISFFYNSQDIVSPQLLFGGRSITHSRCIGLNIWNLGVCFADEGAYSFTTLATDYPHLNKNILMTWTYENGMNCFYTNGILATSAASTFNGSAETADYTIGADTSYGNNLVAGSIDDVRIYNRALSQEEVKMLYQARPVEENVAVIYDGETLISNPLKKDYAKAKYQNITNGLVAWWKLDEISYNGTAGEVKDSSGNENNGTSFGKIITNPSKIGRYSYFDGESCIQLPNIAPVSFPFSVSFWFKTTTATTTLISKYHNSGSYSYLIALYNGKLCGGFGVQGTFGAEAPIGSSQIDGTYNDDKLHFITMSANGLGETEICIDGVLKASAIFATPADINYYAHFIGYESHDLYNIDYITGTFVKFKGSIDDVRIYNRALSPEEVQTLYKYREE